MTDRTTPVRTSRRALLQGAGALGLGALAACTAPADPAPQPPTTQPAASPAYPVIGLTYIPSVQFAPFYVGVKKKLFADGVTLRHHGEQEGLFNALLQGTEQFAVAGGDELVQARAESGADLVAVAQLYHQYPARLIVPTASGIKSLTDLRGKKVGVAGRYGESWIGLTVALALAGMTEKDVEVVEIGYTQQAALRTNRVDAVMGFVNGDAVQLATSGFSARVVPLGDPFPLVSICLVTTGAYAAANPDLVRTVVRGTVGGMKAVVTAPAEALTITGQYVPGLDDQAAAADAKAVLNATIPLYQDAAGVASGALDPAQWDTMSQAMLKNRLITRAVPAKEAMSTAFL